jgi:hypothetical protein
MTHSDFNELLSSIKGLTPGQVRQLREQLDRQHAQPKNPTARTPAKPAKVTKRTKTTQPKKKPLIEAAIRQHMLDIGLMSQLPDTAADFGDPDDQPIPIKGDLLSETIIRERR